MAACYAEARRFSAQAKQLRSAQEHVLLATVRRNQDCWFGRRHGFRHIRSIADFRKRVPIVQFDDIRAEIERICAGEEKVLTTEPVLLLEPTSGTSAEEKLIPFTASLRKEFQRAIRSWIYDLFRHRPAARRGRAYWSISPLAQSRRVTQAGLPIGFADDTAYLGRWEQGIVRRTLAVPPDTALIADVNDSRFATLFFLLQAEDLSLVSIWSPTFLIELLRHMRVEGERLCSSIERGVLDDGERSEHSLARRPFPPNPRRARFLRTVFNARRSESDQIAMIWPKLALVSCWTDAVSATYAAGLKEMLPPIELQPKGLLATEAFVSIPQVGANAAALAYRSHFFEFLPTENDAGNTSDTLLADQLQEGCQYEVIVTTGGGLYRYRLFDQVEVVGHSSQVPLLRFLGRANATSDLVGEKLTEAQAAEAIQASLDEFGIRPSYVRLIPDEGPPPRYVFRIAATMLDPSAYETRLANLLDAHLQRNRAYRYARSLGQLETIRVELLPPAAISYWAQYETASLSQGRQLGDIKASILGSSENK